MIRSWSLGLGLLLGVVLSNPLEVRAQSVAMSGEYGASVGRLSHSPVNPPRTACTQMQNARCHYGERARPTVSMTTVDPLAAASGGVGVPGAGVRVIEGGLSVGDTVTVPPGAFRQAAGHQFTPILNHNLFVQLDTTFVFSMPAASRALNPPAATRVLQSNGWNAAGNGQTGRVAANTTPISTATQNVEKVTVRYQAGPNAFGGTMAAMQDGEGRHYYSGPLVSGTGGGAASTRPWIGTSPLGDGIPNNPSTRFGAGWDYTRMSVLPGAVVRNEGGLAPPCTAATPPAPAGCGLVTDATGFVIRSSPAKSITRHVFAWTTGTVEVLLGGTVGGFPSRQLLTAMGYDTTSMTLSGGTLRNIGLVAGAFTRRSFVGYSFGLNNHEIVGLDMQFSPEPRATAALLIGVGALLVLGARRGSVRET
ncbi:MAG: hypothetical protein AB8G23_17985 [Myxococcota bacterium]